MDEEPRPPDETRRRVLLGLGALGAGALGAGFVFSDRSEVDTTTTRSTRPPRAAAVSAPPSTVSTSTPPPAATRVEPSTTTTVPPVPVVVACREAWRAGPVVGEMIEHVPVRLTLHHTEVIQTALSQGPARARQHQRYHQSLGWPDLAYHFLVDRSGLAYEGRDVRFRGDTATEYDPTGHFLVCMEGNFDVQEPTRDQVDTTVALLAWASQWYGIEASTLAGHGDYADSTTCPGDAVSAMIPDLASAVAESSAVTVDLACGSEGAELVAALEAS